MGRDGLSCLFIDDVKQGLERRKDKVIFTYVDLFCLTELWFVIKVDIFFRSNKSKSKQKKEILILTPFSPKMQYSSPFHIIVSQPIIQHNLCLIVGIKVATNSSLLLHIEMVNLYKIRNVNYFLVKKKKCNAYLK